MIEKYWNNYTPVCDICGTELPGEESWRGAKEAIRKAGWKIQKNEDGEYEHICPTCKNGGTDNL